MKKLDKIKEYFIKNNITIITGGYCNFPNGPKARFSLNFYVDLDDPNTFSKDIIVCLKKENTSYLIDFLAPKPRYQKIGDYDKGHQLAFDIMLYFSSWKYENSPDEFIDSQKQIYQKNGAENIKKYEDFWAKKISEYPEYSHQIISRLNVKLRRNLKLKKLNTI